MQRPIFQFLSCLRHGAGLLLEELALHFHRPVSGWIGRTPSRTGYALHPSAVVFCIIRGGELGSWRIPPGYFDGDATWLRRWAIWRGGGAPRYSPAPPETG